MHRAILAGPLAILLVAGGCKEVPAVPAGSGGLFGAAEGATSDAETAFCDGVPAMDLRGRVTDAANILKPEEERRLSERLARYEDRTRHQMVVATTPDLNGARVDNSGTCLGQRWRIGRKDHDDGIVILVAPHERELNIATGLGMEKMLTDGKALAVIHQMTPHFEKGDYAGGLSTGIEAIAAQTGDAS